MQNITTSIHESIAVITLNRPNKHNALTVEMYTELAKQLEIADDNPNIHTVVLQGQSTVFCAGNDLNDFQIRPDAVQPAGRRFGKILYSFSKPLIASVCGNAIGIGATMLLHFDIVYAGDNAKFVFPFVKLGLVPEAASTLLLPRLIGHHRAAQVMLSGGKFSAQQGYDWGFVEKITSPDQCSTMALQKAMEISKIPIESVMATKHLIKLRLIKYIEEQKTAEGLIFDDLLKKSSALKAFRDFTGK